MVGGVAGLCGTCFLGERYGKKKLRKLKAKKIEEIDAMRASIIFDQSPKFQRVMDHVNKEYHEAFREWL